MVKRHRIVPSHAFDIEVLNSPYEGAVKNLLKGGEADPLAGGDTMRGWTPLQGRLTLELADLRHAHPRLRDALEHYAVQPNSFVSATHLSRREGRALQQRRRVSFTFDSAALVQLLRM